MRELDKLEKYLSKRRMAYERKMVFSESGPGGAEQIVVYKDGHRIWDVIEDRADISGMRGLLEGCGVIFRDYIEQVSAEELIYRLKLFENLQEERLHVCAYLDASHQYRGCDVDSLKS